MPDSSDTAIEPISACSGLVDERPLSSVSWASRLSEVLDGFLISMRVLAIVMIASVLAVPSFTAGQPKSVSKVADKAWPAFFASFRAAVRTRDRKSLRSLLAPDLLFSLGHHRVDHLEQAFGFWDADNARGWKAFDRILKQGTAPEAAWWNSGAKPNRPSRVAPAAANQRRNIDRGRIGWYAIFEFREDGRWYCVIFQQCCD
jgi:hypothetical protein